MTGNLWSDLTKHLPNYFIIVNNHVKTKTDRPYVRLFSEKILLILNPSLTTLIGILFITAIMLTLATVTSTVKLRSVTMVALNVYDCLANVRKIKSGLHRGLSAVLIIKINCLRSGLLRYPKKMKRNTNITGHSIIK